MFLTRYLRRELLFREFYEREETELFVPALWSGKRYNIQRLKIKWTKNNMHNKYILDDKTTVTEIKNIKLSSCKYCLLSNL